MNRTDENRRANNVGRRYFCTAAGLAVATFAVLSQAAAQESPAARLQVETSTTKSPVIRDSRHVLGDLTTAEILVDSVIRWRVSYVVGLVRDGILSGPDAEQLHAAVNILNSGRRIAILAGQGALAARPKMQSVAERPGAPVANALLGKAVLPDDIGRRYPTELEVVAPTVGGLQLNNGESLKGDHKFGGGPSVLFDAVAILNPADATGGVLQNATVGDFIPDALAHLEFIGYTEAAMPRFRKPGVADSLDEACAKLNGPQSAGDFINACRKLLSWKREETVTS